MKNVVLFLLSLSIGTQLCFAQTKKDSLYVFVGERISIEEFSQKKALEEATPPVNTDNLIFMNLAFHAKYKVIQNVYNNPGKDTIDFDAYDHYGKPGFAQYKYVLLFVSLGKSGKYYHEQYQYYNVYPTADNRWASPGDPYRFNNPEKRTIGAVPIKFKKPLIFNLKRVSAAAKQNWYVAPWYDIKGNKATALMGLYVEDLFRVKKEMFFGD